MLDGNKPIAIPVNTDDRLVSLEPYRKAIARIRSIIHSPAPSSLFGVHKILTADHVRNRNPNTWPAVSDVQFAFAFPGSLGEPRHSNMAGNETASNAHRGVVAAPAIPGQ